MIEPSTHADATGGDATRADVSRLVLDFMQMEEFAKDPFVVAEAEGIRLSTTDGREYIDGLAGVFTVSLGHGNRGDHRRRSPRS